MTKNFCIFVLLFTAVSGSTRQARSEDTSFDSELIGEWRIVADQVDGRVIASRDPRRVYRFDRRELNSPDPKTGEPCVAAYVVDISKQPKQISYTIKSTGRTWYVKAIYTTAGGSLTICGRGGFEEDKVLRPTDFSSTPKETGSEVELVTYSRVHE